jgi:hypothetical protein
MQIIRVDWQAQHYIQCLQKSEAKNDGSAGSVVGMVVQGLWFCGHSKKAMVVHGLWCCGHADKL